MERLILQHILFFGRIFISMSDLIYAPVIVTTIFRYEKFRNCIESLSKCTDADKTEIFIGVDYPAKEEHWPGYLKIKEYLPRISGFKKVNVFLREENLGQGKNGRDLRERISKEYDRYIMTEDDNVFSPNFLVYMNQCLEKYKDDERVVKICGFSYREWENVGDYPYNAYPMNAYCAWGTGGWFEKMKEYRSFLSAKDIVFDKKIVHELFSLNKHMIVHRMMFRWEKSPADLRYICYCALKDKYCIFPTVSKVRNMGFDEEASNCTSINKYESQKIDENIFFELDNFEIKKYEQINRLHDRHFSASIRQRLFTRFEYWQWRHTGKVFKDYKFTRALIKLRVKWLLND